MDYMMPDKYSISSAILDMQKNQLELGEEDVLLASMNGLVNSIFSKQIQTQLEAISVIGRESMPLKAKLPKNVITYAVDAGITDINAIPSSIDVQIYLEENLLKSLFPAKTINDKVNNAGTIIISNMIPFYFGDFEFHLDYDIELTRVILSDDSVMYTAIYNLAVKNPISNIVDPNISTPVIIKYKGTDYVILTVSLHQISKSVVTKSYTSDNLIENKSLEFVFQDELASIQVFLTMNDVTHEFNPYLMGSAINELDKYYCTYEFIDDKRIRVLFSNNSYIPQLSDELTITIQTTKGKNGSFKYQSKTSNGVIENCEDIIYNNLPYMIVALSDSVNGKNMKSTEELKQLIPLYKRSIQSLGIEADLNDYMKLYNSRYSSVTFLPKVNNNIQVMFYSFMSLKDNIGRIVPTNTIPIIVKESDFDNVINEENPSEKSYILNQGNIIGLKQDGDQYYGIILHDEDSLDEYEFVYSNPYKLSVSFNGPIVSYYLNSLNLTRQLEFTYINKNAPLQFISSIAHIKRDVDMNYYSIQMTLVQSILDNRSIIAKNEKGEILSSLKFYAIAFNSENSPHRYFIGEIIDFSEEDFSFKIEFKLETDDIINEHDELNLTNGYIRGTTDQFEGLLPNNMRLSIYVLGNFDENYGDYGLSNIIPVSEYEGYSVTNIYSINDTNLFVNYSDNCNSVVKVRKDDDSFSYLIKDVPVIGRNYLMKQKEGFSFVVSELAKRKEQLNDMMKLVNNGFSLDMKFYNTYGPSKLYFTDIERTQSIGNINITMTINLALLQKNDDYTERYIIQYLRDYVENTDDKNGKTIHIPIIMKEIAKKYENSIDYIELDGINGFDARKSHLYYKEKLEYGDIPEILNFDINDSGEPTIIVNRI